MDVYGVSIDMYSCSYVLVWDVYEVYRCLFVLEGYSRGDYRCTLDAQWGAKAPHLARPWS